MTPTLSMIKSVVVYHSGYGHTERMATAVAEGASATLVAIDAEGNIAEDKWVNKIFGGFTNSASINGDKLNTLAYFFLLAGQHTVSLVMRKGKSNEI